MTHLLENIIAKTNRVKFVIIFVLSFYVSKFVSSFFMGKKEDTNFVSSTFVFYFIFILAFSFTAVCNLTTKCRIST